MNQSEGKGGKVITQSLEKGRKYLKGLSHLESALQCLMTHPCDAFQIIARDRHIPLQYHLSHDIMNKQFTQSAQAGKTRL